MPDLLAATAVGVTGIGVALVVLYEWHETRTRSRTDSMPSTAQRARSVGRSAASSSSAKLSHERPTETARVRRPELPRLRLLLTPDPPKGTRPAAIDYDNDSSKEILGAIEEIRDLEQLLALEAVWNVPGCSATPRRAGPP
jgi:hypothetical protein